MKHVAWKTFALFTVLAAAFPRPSLGQGAALDAGRPWLVSRTDPSLLSDTPGAGSAGVSGNGANVWSADGRYLVFWSDAPNLAPGQVEQNQSNDVFLLDAVTGAVTLVSHAAGSPSTTGNAYSNSPEISADGRYVVYSSFATDLVAGQVDANNWTDIFLYDRITDTTVLVSHAAGFPAVACGSGAGGADFAGGGRFVAFASGGNNLVAGMTDLSGSDVFLYDQTTGNSQLVSRSASSSTTSANSSSLYPRISDDGAYVTLQSRGTNLVTGQVDANSADDVFVWTRSTGAMALLSRTAASAVTTGNAGSEAWRISADGGQILFKSKATNLITGQSDANAGNDVFLYNRATGARTLVTRASSGAATAANAATETALLSADGNFVAFASGATNLISGLSDTNGRDDVFLYNRATGTTVLVSHTSASLTTAASNTSLLSWISADGARVLFGSSGGNLVAGQTEGNVTVDAFLYTRATGAVQLLSHVPGSLVTTGSDGSSGIALSPDASLAAFSSHAGNLVTGLADNNGASDLFLYDRATDTVSIATLRDPGAPTWSAGGIGTLATSTASPISADGRHLVYLSNAADMVAGETETSYASNDVFLFDRDTGVTVRVSPTANITWTNGIQAQSPAISADGGTVVFRSNASNLIPGITDANGSSDDIYLYDRPTDTLSLVSHNSANPNTTVLNGGAQAPLVSGDGRYVVYAANATNAVAGQSDANGAADVFLYDRTSDTAVLVSHSSGGAATSGNAASQSPAVSTDGRFVAFASMATNLVAGQTDTAGTWDVFLFDQVTGAVTLVSRTAASATTAAGVLSQVPALSADGRFVAYASASTSLVAGQVDTNAAADVFLFDAATGTTVLVSHTPSSSVTAAGAASQGPAISADGSLVVYASAATNLVASQADGNGAADVFLYDRTLDTTTLVSALDGFPAATGSAASQAPRISADGSLITFLSTASNLVAGQVEVQGVQNGLGNGYFNDVFVFHVPTGRRRLVSHSEANALTTADAGSLPAELAFPSADGRHVAFASAASDLADPADGDFNSRQDVFLMTPFADLVVTKTDGVGELAPGDPVTYTITVSNNGPGGVRQGEVTDLFPSLLGVSWTCAASGGAVCTAAGSGLLFDTVDIPAGGSVTYTATGTVDPEIDLEVAETLTNTATATVPLEALDPTVADATAEDTDLLIPEDPE